MICSYSLTHRQSAGGFALVAKNHNLCSISCYRVRERGKSDKNYIFFSLIAKI